MDKLDNKDKKDFIIKDIDDYKEKVSAVYSLWQKNQFSSQWIDEFETKWILDDYFVNLIKLVKLKRILSDDDYRKQENEVMSTYDDGEILMGNIIKVFKAEKEAFKKAGIQEGTVEYTCPICGGRAIANRYEYNGSYHGLGSGCSNCGIRHS